MAITDVIIQEDSQAVSLSQKFNLQHDSDDILSLLDEYEISSNCEVIVSLRHDDSATTGSSADILHGCQALLSLWSPLLNSKLQQSKFLTNDLIKKCYRPIAAREFGIEDPSLHFVKIPPLISKEILLKTMQNYQSDSGETHLFLPQSYRESLEEVLNNYARDRDEYLQCSGVLFYGPPGTGSRTMIVCLL